MAANLDFSDLLTRVMNTLRLPVTNAVEAAKVSNLINLVYRDVCAKQDWLWLQEREVINTSAVLTSGTVSVTLGSSAVDFTDPPTMDVTDRAFFVPGNALDSLAVYRVASTGSSASNFILDGQYTGATSTEAGYRLWEDLIQLPDDTAKVLQVKRYGHWLPVNLIGKNMMGQLKINDTSEGKPDYATVVNQYAVVGTSSVGSTSTDTEANIGRRQLQIHPYPDKAYRLEILIKQNLNTELTSTGSNTRPLIPDQFAEVLFYGTVARAYSIFLADESRGQQYQQLFNDALSLMAAQDKEYSRDLPQLQPADDYRRIGRRRNRAASGYTLGGLFDRFPANWP